MSEEEIKNFIRENLVITVEFSSRRYSACLDQDIELSFKGDDHSFTHAEVFIPSEPD